MEFTPLWPAGHLPLKGGDHVYAASFLSCEAGDLRYPCVQLISPLEGEMAGRPEGGENATVSRASPHDPR
jgi:hypothetical protein